MNRLSSVLAVFLTASCSASHGTPRKSHVQDTANETVQTDSVEPAFRCNIGQNERLTILLFASRGSAHDLELERIIIDTTDEFRKLAVRSGVKLSDYRGLTIRERVVNGCIGVFGLSKPYVQNDSECMTNVARVLNTDWLLSGFVETSSHGYLIEVQLTSGIDSRRSRSTTFSLTLPKELSVTATEAWHRVTAP